MAWYSREETAGQRDLAARLKAEAEANEANRRRKEEQASGFGVVTWPRR